MKDEFFKKLEWDDEWWKTSVEIPFFREIGARFDENSEEVIRGATAHGAQGAVRPNPPIPLTIHTGGERRRPTAGQIEAWRRLCDRGEHVWRECITRLRPEYELQRPARIRWWTATYGAAGIDDVLPEVKDDATFASLMAPIYIRILEPAPKSAVVDIGVTFSCTWYTDNCGSLIRNGEVVEVGNSSVAAPMIVPVQERTAHPFFGALRRMQKGGPWIAEVRIEPFLDFAAIAATRAAYARDPANVRKRSDLGWSFARGEFPVLIYADPGVFTLDQAAATLAEFQSDVVANANAVLQAILAHYRQTRDERRRADPGPDVDARFPEIASIEDLRNLIELIAINLFAGANEPVGIIGFEFIGFGKGVGVRWRNGAIEEVGLAKIVRPQRQR